MTPDMFKAAANPNHNVILVLPYTDLAAITRFANSR